MHKLSIFDSIGLRILRLKTVIRPAGGNITGMNSV